MEKTIKLLLALLFVISCGCKKDAQETNKTYLALGDSYTIGERVEESGRYPNQLRDTLEAMGVDMKAPLIIATTGWTTRDLIEGIKQAGPDSTYDLVTLLIGVNNQYQGQDTSLYRVEFTTLLTQAVDFAGGKKENVIVISIPDWGVMPFAEGRNRQQIAEEIDDYNRINREISGIEDISYVDVTGISRQADSIPQFVADDGLHPSAEMYAEWVRLLAPLAIDKLKSHGHAK